MSHKRFDKETLRTYFIQYIENSNADSAYSILCSMKQHITHLLEAIDHAREDSCYLQFFTYRHIILLKVLRRSDDNKI